MKVVNNAHAVVIAAVDLPETTIYTDGGGTSSSISVLLDADTANFKINYLVTMKTNKIKAVLFDWDLTLARVLGDVPTSTRIATLLAHEGLDYSADEIETAVKTRRNYLEEGKLHGTLEPQTRRGVVQFYKQLLILLDAKHASAAFANHLYSEFGRLPALIYEDTLAVLQILAQKGLSLGIISNNATSARNTIEQAVGDYIDSKCIVLSEDLGVHKPAKSIYQYAAARVRASPLNCAYIGDNLQVDAIGAVKYGKFGLGLWIDRKNTGTGQVLPRNVQRITSLYEVANFVA